MVQTRPGETVGTDVGRPLDVATLAGSAAQYQRAQRSQLARVEQIERINKQIVHLIKASDRLGVAPIRDNIALEAMDTINYEVEQLEMERDQLQIEADLSLADALAIAQRRTSLINALLSLPDEAIAEALWTLYEAVDGDRAEFCDDLGLDPNHPDAAFLFDQVHNTIGDRP